MKDTTRPFVLELMSFCTVYNYRLQVVVTTLFTHCYSFYHSMASSSPSPFKADVLKIDHVRFFSADRPNALDISEGVMAPSKSCLLANTISIAFLSSSSWNVDTKFHNYKQLALVLVYTCIQANITCSHNISYSVHKPSPSLGEVKEGSFC